MVWTLKHVNGVRSEYMPGLSEYNVSLVYLTSCGWFVVVWLKEYIYTYIYPFQRACMTCMHYMIKSCTWFAGHLDQTSCEATDIGIPCKQLPCHAGPHVDAAVLGHPKS